MLGSWHPGTRTSTWSYLPTQESHKNATQSKPLVETVFSWGDSLLTFSIKSVLYSPFPTRLEDCFWIRLFAYWVGPWYNNVVDLWTKRGKIVKSKKTGITNLCSGYPTHQIDVSVRTGSQSQQTDKIFPTRVWRAAPGMTFPELLTSFKGQRKTHWVEAHGTEKVNQISGHSLTYLFWEPGWYHTSSEKRRSWHSKRNHYQNYLRSLNLHWKL